MSFITFFVLELEQDLIETTKVLNIMRSCIENPLNKRLTYEVSLSA